MKKRFLMTTTLFAAIALTLGACGAKSKNSHEVGNEPVDEQGIVIEPTVAKLDNEGRAERSSYKEGIVLVKAEKHIDKHDLCLDIQSIEDIYPNSPWKRITLKSGDTQEAIDYLLETNLFSKVDYDFIMGSDGVVDVSSNPNSTEQGYLDTQGIFDGWGYQQTNGNTPGGNPDVVVAVIDTGVDYNHIDLRNNIWTNSGEIPNNGIDDDKNGYIDDYYGWDCVGNDKDPIDDNGHGTHVAGIIAAENNTIGTVGVAYNCKIMCVKAGNSSGYFSNSDIAEAIRYAYMNGASVINMSFGGSNISTAVEDALEDAYNQCVLVAAAGNDGLCNNLKHAKYHDTGISYPAALSYVIGVMSTNSNGTIVSGFSNYDDTPYDTVEYETYACGEQIPSTWPNNKIAKLSGTSMASPVVAGIAALLRSKYLDREIYSNKFIQSQIVNTGTTNPYIASIKSYDNGHSFANAYEALTRIPKPKVNLYDYYIFDNESFDSANNGNGIIEAGETIHLAIELFNRGGVASNVRAMIDTIRNGDPSLTDPYFSIVNNTITLPDIGTYSIRNCKKIYDNDNVIDTELYFEIKVSSDCPNDYMANINVRFTYNNGLDNQDLTTYSDDGLQKVTLFVSNGFVVPTIITEDTTFEANRLYIVAEPVVISANATVTFEPGSTIQYYAKDSSYYGGEVLKSPEFVVYGNLNLIGTQTDMIKILISEGFPYCCGGINSKGTTTIEYVDATNLVFRGTDITIKTSSIKYDSSSRYAYGMYFYGDGSYGYASSYTGAIFTLIKDTYIDIKTACYELAAREIDGCYIEVSSTGFNRVSASTFTNNLFYSVNMDNIRETIPSRMLFSMPTIATNNAFLTSSESANSCYRFDFSQGSKSTISNNYFSETYKRNASKVFDNYFTSSGEPTIDLNEECSDYSLIYPFIKAIDLFDKENKKISSVGKEEFTIKITFSRDMDTTFQPNVYFGTVFPYSDYKITGDYISGSVWQGNYTVKAFIENGTQFYRIKGAYSKDENTGVVKELLNAGSTYSFEIDTTAALSMSLEAFATDGGINLEWAQDDYDTLMGYNIYRSTSKDGNYVRLNNSVIPAGENTFIDENAEPGVTYWYTFTVVFSDMSESAPAGKVSCTAMDTIAPSVYHAPVNQGYLNNNLVISCTASDNIGIQNVTLYYRTKGQVGWKSLAMLKQNDRYSATIFGSDLSLDGLEYYIVASDGVNTINKGSADNPYSVIIKDASSISRLGDVDGDGVVTTKDALMIMQAINGDLILTDDQFQRADLNKDGQLSSVEALRILQYINGNVSTLEM